MGTRCRPEISPPQGPLNHCGQTLPSILARYLFFLLAQLPTFTILAQFAENDEIIFSHFLDRPPKSYLFFGWVFLIFYSDNSLLYQLYQPLYHGYLVFSDYLISHNQEKIGGTTGTTGTT